MSPLSPCSKDAFITSLDLAVQVEHSFLSGNDSQFVSPPSASRWPCVRLILETVAVTHTGDPGHTHHSAVRRELPASKTLLATSGDRGRLTAQPSAENVVECLGPARRRGQHAEPAVTAPSPLRASASRRLRSFRGRPPGRPGPAGPAAPPSILSSPQAGWSR